MTNQHYSSSTEDSASTTEALNELQSLFFITTSLPSEIAGLSVRQLNLSRRTLSPLIRAGIRSIGQLADMSDEELLKIKNFGVTFLKEARQALQNISQADVQEIIESQEAQQLVVEFPVLHSMLPTICDFPLRLLQISTRTINALQRAHIYTLDELLGLRKSALFDIRNIGEKGVSEISKVLRSMNIAELQQVMVNLHEQGKRPDQLPLTCLGMPTLYQRLNALGIEHFEHLCHYTAEDLQHSGLQSVHITSIVAMLRSYGLALRSADSPAPHVVVEQSFVDADVGLLEDLSAIQETDTLPEKQPILVEDVIHKMLAQVDSRQADVLRWRYGLEGTSAHTLEESGKYVGVTRERVRQIEQKAIKKLQQPHYRSTVKPVVQLLELALREANGVLSFEAIQEVVSTYTTEGFICHESLITFILLFAPQMKQNKKLLVLSLNDEQYSTYTSLLPTICAVLKRVVAEALAPLPPADVLTRFVAEMDDKTIRLHVPETFILACLNAHPDIVVDDEGLYGLKQWANKRLDDIIVVLRQHGKPMHYSKIAERVNKRLPANQQTTAHNVHAHIGRLPHLFIRVGRGLFGLAEWGLVQENCSADTAYRILCETGHALDIEALIDRVLEVWQVQRISVRAAIDLDARFTQVSRGRYWLTEAPSSDRTGERVANFDTLFGDVLLRRREELEEDSIISNRHDALEEARRLGTSIFD